MAITALQSTDRILLVRPAAFGFNADAARSNAMQRELDVDPAETRSRALAEFDALHRALVNEGIRVCVAADQAPPPRPDAVFPNNWISFHADGTVVLYPLQPASRRPERRAELIEVVAGELGFQQRRLLDLSRYESEDCFLEGTGSLVLDHPGRQAFACRSARTHERLVQLWCDELAYTPRVFDGTDAAGRPYYHTNVMLSIGTRWALVCAEAIGDADRDATLAALAAAGRQVVTISRAQVQCFVGNVLELATWDEALGDSTVLLISATARAALEPAQLAALAGCVDSLLVIPVPVIETVGGGSVRCMVAEVFVA